MIDHPLSARSTAPRVGRWMKELFCLVGIIGVGAAWGGVEWVATRSVEIEYSRGVDIDLGSLPAGVQRFEFEIRNRGTTTLELESIGSTCGCLGAKADSASIPPLRVTQCRMQLLVTPRERRSVFLYVRYKEPRSRIDAIRVVFSGAARGTLVSSTPTIVLRRDPIADAFSGSLSVHLVGQWRDDDSPWVNAVLTPAEAFEGESVIGTFDPATRVAWVEVSRAYEGQPTRSRSLNLSVGAPPIARLEVPVQLIDCEGNDVVPRYLAGVVRSGEEYSVVGTLECKVAPGWRVAGIVGPDWLRAELKTMESTKGTRVVVTARGDAVGAAIGGELFVKLCTEDGREDRRRVRFAIERDGRSINMGTKAVEGGAESR